MHKQLDELLNLFECSMLMCPRMEKMKAYKKDTSNDTCSVCTNGGKLLCCDSYTSTFHIDALPSRF